jgi:hypothetical protein
MDWIHQAYFKGQFRVFVKTAVAQLVEALRYKPERRGFDSDGVT